MAVMIGACILACCILATEFFVLAIYGTINRMLNKSFIFILSSALFQSLALWATAWLVIEGLL